MFSRETVKKKSIVHLLALITLIFLSATRDIPAELQDVVDTKETSEVILYLGDLVTLRVYSLTRVAVSKTEIVDIVNTDVDEILLTGKETGETTVFIWDQYGKRAMVVRVLAEDLALTSARIRRLLASAGISGVSLEENKYEGKIIATGKTTRRNKEAVSEILKDFGDIVIDMVKEAGSLIQIDVQITELSTTIQKELGVDWSTSLNYQETLPARRGGRISDFFAIGDKKVNDFFKVGDFNRTTAILATVKALISEGKGRILSNPSLVVTEGEEASFNVGGEIPIRTTTVGTVSTESVTYKSYGITLTVTPDLRDDKIDITLNVEIKDIDESTRVGVDVGFTTRTTQTKVLLNDAQTIVIAGLIKTNKSDTVSRVPFLSKIPVFGVLFRKTSAPATDLELVISMTPRIMKEREERGRFASYETDMPAWHAGMPSRYAGVGMIEDDQEDALATGAQAGLPIGQAGGTTEEWPGMPFDEAWASETEFDQGRTPQEGDLSQAITTYAQGIQRRISQAISFPYEAKQRGWQGTVTVVLVIASDGSLDDILIKEPSGRDVFDKDAVDTAQILAPFDPFPVELNLEELEVTVPIVYSQEAVWGE